MTKMLSTESKIKEDLKETEEISCGICGKNHLLENCTLLPIKYHVFHREIPPKAQLTLPTFLEVKKLSDSTFDVVTQKPIKKGTQFGPFEAQRTLSMKPSIDFPLKVFLPHEEEKFLDTTNENECNWMIFISPAGELKEQNLICYQDQNEVYYSSIRDINEGESLKVWYSPHYAKKMNKNVLVSSKLDETPDFYSTNLNYLVQKQQNVITRDTWNCKFCDKVESDVVLFAKHLLNHYEAKLRKVCEICKDTFANGLRLNKHKKIVHGISRADIAPKENVMKEIDFGGPLLSGGASDNFLLQSTDENSLSNSENSDFLLGNEESLFDFELNDDQNEKMICDICLRGYTKLKSLVQHLRMHTGQFYCAKCNKIFCRNETFSNHGCRKNLTTFECSYCNKMFYLKKYLNQHVLAKHLKQHHCIKCKKFYATKSELEKHNCVQVPTSEKKQYKCGICDKVFYRERYLREHQKRHQSGKREKVEVLCEICPLKYNSKSSLRRHLRKVHGKSEEVDKKTPKTVDCPMCKKTLKCKDNLRNHLLTHSTERKYSCTLCSISFKFQASLLKHKKNKHSMNVAKKLIHESLYACPKCNKKMKIRGSLNRHLKRAHIEYYNELKMKKSKTNVATKSQENEFNLMDSIENIDFSNMATGNELNIDDMLNNTANIDNFLVEESGDKIVENLLDDIGKEGDSLEREVCLSMPDLMENDQEIQLGRNAYILDNGTIVEPQEDSDNVVIYLLNQKF